MVGFLRLSPGAVFADDFEVRQVLAKGGMGTVYVAYDRLTGQVCALKVLLPELVADENSRRRFAQEARVAGDIDSPYLPRIHRAGVDERSGVPYIAMDLLEGRDLRRRIAESGPLSIEEAARILAQLGHALGAAHRLGLVHRDLKPENVFLDEAVSPPEVRLLDFGVAKVLDAHRTSATGTGAIGSPMWMAPEQTSAGGRISPATDVWALGLLTFFVLTGKIFWKSAHDPSGIAGLLRELHVDPIEPASVRAAWLKIETALPPGFDAWFARAVARDPASRFRGADEAMAALRPVMSTGPDWADRSDLAFAQTMEVSRREVADAMKTAPMGSVDAPTAGEARSETPTPMDRQWTNAAIDEDRREIPAPPSRDRDAERGVAEGEAIPPTDPPPPMVAAPARRTSPLVWAALIIVVGIAVSLLSAVIVWVALTISDPGDRRRRRPPPAPTGSTQPAHPDPLEPLEVVPSGTSEEDGS